jgi:hypothetical protein
VRQVYPAWVLAHAQRLGAAMTVLDPASGLRMMADSEPPPDLPDHGWYASGGPVGEPGVAYIHVDRNAQGRAIRGAFRSTPPEGIDPATIPSRIDPPLPPEHFSEALDKLDHFAVHFAEGGTLTLFTLGEEVSPSSGLGDAEALAIYRATSELRGILAHRHDANLLRQTLQLAATLDSRPALEAMQRIAALFRRRRMLDAPTAMVVWLLRTLRLKLNESSDEVAQKYMQAIVAHASMMLKDGETAAIAVRDILLIHALRILETKGLQDLAMERLSAAEADRVALGKAEGEQFLGYLYDGAFHALCARYLLTYLRRSGGQAFDKANPLAARAENVADELAVRCMHATITSWKNADGRRFAEHVLTVRLILRAEGRQAADDYAKSLVQEFIFYPATYLSLMIDLAGDDRVDDQTLGRRAASVYLETEGLIGP